jgi:hypothetical protein
MDTVRFNPKWATHNWGPVCGILNFCNRFIRDRFPNGHLKMVEIGSYMGESTCLFAGSNLFDTIWSVDIWRFDELEQIYNSNIATLYPDIIKSIKSLSSTAAKNWDRGLVDLVYIDASHDYDSAIEDIILWSKIVKPGGIISGHDYNKNVWPGVYKAVNECFSDRSITVFCDTSWAIVLD